MSSKRPLSPRSPSPSSPSSTVKALRTSPPLSVQRQLICTLPPTCNPPMNKPCHLSSAAELERHYATYHAHVCEQRGCGAVFPEERLLELHQTECHDPIAALRKEKGEKIFACYLPSCPRLFSTPKTRRLHLIQAHGYPKEYFFAVTNKGVGGLLKKWGEGASLVRGEWMPRERKNGENMDEASEHEDEEHASDEESGGPVRIPAVSTKEGQAPGFRLGDGPLVEEESDSDRASQSQPSGAPAPEVDNLTQAVDALSLVPPHVRFGRGTKSGGFAHPPRARDQHQQPRRGHARKTSTEGMDIDTEHTVERRHGKGRGRGKSRGHARRVSRDIEGDSLARETEDDATAVEDAHPVNTRRPPMPPRGLGRGLGGGGAYGRGRIHIGGQGYGRRY
ncbi:uncharacterized protein PHACADRAFT_178528 [Phanerochaete carnosa HHB-10118-sp]|uniref:C2H2-type domain-containing protein n=1 Tax=Phanerochaete carnosa (strain HHB-10118-sp) TaxID=650164 RepID=K5VHV8_PHACS|nr:uncharacterized protein PHACADRAFT_178528 [Phanerochaete carnosa HHB-10118-sp]EKM50828.1 hypothetical protein PHACADRAFT_178528 [Phanerochaete carnosa HHB-10118-sp]